MIARSSESGSSAITCAYRAARTRVSFPVPAPRSRTVASSGTGSASRISGGQPGRPRSYSSAAHWKAVLCSADTGEQERTLLLQHLASDHQALDLVRPLVDLRDLRIAHHPLDGVL